MAPKTKINLKERLEDGELDLSLSDLQDVPVREIALLKKATSLDLSNNRLTSLGKNFSSLTHIIKLDLSKNLLTELPEDFGELRQLKHLDLYSNQITHLPLSFHQLKSLRWLDLKNNPLIPAVAKIAGPCLDAPQCTQCARSVVTFFTQMNDQVEEEKARREQQKQADMETEVLQQKQVPKKKEKKKSKKEKKNKKEKSQEIVQPVAVQVPIKKPTNKKKQKPKSNLCVTLLKTLFFSFTFSCVFLFILSSMKTNTSMFIRQKSAEIWADTLRKIPSEYTPWATKVENQVLNLHSMTGRVVENILVMAEEIRKDERVNKTVTVLWDTLKVVGSESKKLIVDLGDQALVWTNEIKKSLKL